MFQIKSPKTIKRFGLHLGTMDGSVFLINNKTAISMTPELARSLAAELPRFASLAEQKETAGLETRPA
jgi:hypothetical protein